MLQKTEQDIRMARFFPTRATTQKAIHVRPAFGMAREGQGPHPMARAPPRVPMARIEGEIESEVQEGPDLSVEGQVRAPLPS